MANAKSIPRASLWDSLTYNFGHMVPNYLGGLFTRNRFGFGLVEAVHKDPAAVGFCTRLRDKYDSDYLYLRLPGGEALLILDPEGIRHVLDNSPEIYAEPKIKREGMSHFMPDALTISRGEEWKDRRRFNEAVLDSDRDLHRFAEDFLGIVRSETGATLKQAGEQLTWEDFARLFPRITLQIIFGAGVTDTSITDDLQAMMREGNRAFALGRSKHFDRFYAKVGEHLAEARPASLAFLCSHALTTEKTRIANQVPHWIFAMADTLAINTARALALIAAHSGIERQVRAELSGIGSDSAADIDRLTLLEGCVQEAMRLWPTTPLLARETIREDVLGGETIPAGTQVLILNSFNHRDPENLDFADTFSPQIWQKGEVDYRFNHLSNGAQVFAGRNLALFIAKAVLVGLLAEKRYVLEKPALNPDAPLPYRYNHFQLEFRVEDLD